MSWPLRQVVTWARAWDMNEEIQVAPEISVGGQEWEQLTGADVIGG